MQNNIVIKADNLSYKVNGVEILKNVSFIINKGEFVGLIGPNGAGKSTLAKIIIGQIKNFKGHVEVNGTIGYLPQIQTINREVPILAIELVQMGAYRKYKRKLSFSYKKATELMKRVGLDSHINQLVSSMSGGELQRLSLARALLSEPDILILDEPEAGVDQMGKAQFYTLIDEIRKEHNITIIMISHDIGMVFEKCTTVMCLNKTLHCHGPSEKISPEELKELFPDFDLWIRGKNHYEREHKL
ncbi:metal ABC transporter ATP-binding protein [Thermosipho ferrireducens]|uniref:Metal ABC transporter ATP-binding protein n=1 Tax=Thermosipho ferrireducens TaxID=2571116 RepID=A0ABX7S874_9BACT|nr:metal ABC transporter ATP-binding protein [Thermosipho ferrireducens]QTA38108.1 metal ABC transporter ATP-binding protein [Thermosipho ferrireducens]